MIHSAVFSRPRSTRRLMNALRRKTTGSEVRVSAVSRGSHASSPAMRNTLPTGDLPSATLWGED
jgi:hypothetical protein